MSQLDNTPMKITYGAFLKEAPDACADLIQHLGNFGQANDRTAATRGTPVPRAVHQPAPPAPAMPRPFVPPGAVADTGPTPMETNFETEACYHSENKPAYVSAVVRAEVDILGKTFDCIVDTGASNTVLGHSVVRKLGLLDRLMPSRMSFLTAAGRSERPMGVLPDLPVTLGSLCLHLNCMVTKASNYSVLVGNDWLRMAGADLLLSSGVLRVRLGPEQYEDIRIDTDGDQPNISMCKPAKGRHLHHAVQCLGQATALHEHIDNQIKESTAAMTMICTTSDTDDMPDLISDYASDSDLDSEPAVASSSRTLPEQPAASTSDYESTDALTTDSSEYSLGFVHPDDIGLKDISGRVDTQEEAQFSQPELWPKQTSESDQDTANTEIMRDDRLVSEQLHLITATMEPPEEEVQSPKAHTVAAVEAQMPTQRVDSNNLLEISAEATEEEEDIVTGLPPFLLSSQDWWLEAYMDSNSDSTAAWNGLPTAADKREPVVRDFNPRLAST
ncbi:TPA: hypothetical protein ACH3X2_013331 [Trebouxia sp. C0005]